MRFATGSQAGWRCGPISGHGFIYRVLINLCMKWDNSSRCEYNMSARCCGGPESSGIESGVNKLVFSYYLVLGGTLNGIGVCYVHVL